MKIIYLFLFILSPVIKATEVYPEYYIDSSCEGVNADLSDNSLGKSDYLDLSTLVEQGFQYLRNHFEFSSYSRDMSATSFQSHKKIWNEYRGQYQIKKFKIVCVDIEGSSFDGYINLLMGMAKFNDSQTSLYDRYYQKIEFNKIEININNFLPSYYEGLQLTKKNFIQMVFHEAYHHLAGIHGANYPDYIIACSYLNFNSEVYVKRNLLLTEKTEAMRIATKICLNGKEEDIQTEDYLKFATYLKSQGLLFYLNSLVNSQRPVPWLEKLGLRLPKVSEMENDSKFSFFLEMIKNSAKKKMEATNLSNCDDKLMDTLGLLLKLD